MSYDAKRHKAGLRVSYKVKNRIYKSIKEYAEETGYSYQKAQRILCKTKRTPEGDVVKKVTEII